MGRVIIFFCVFWCYKVGTGYCTNREDTRGTYPSWQGHGWALKLRGPPYWDLNGSLGMKPSSHEPAADCHLRKRLPVPSCQRCTRQEIERCRQSPAAGEQWVEFPLSVRRGLFVTREIKAQGKEKGLSGDMWHAVPLRTDSIGNLFWGLSPLLPLKESSVKRMKINLILLSRSGWREPQTRYWFLYPWHCFIFTSPQPSSRALWFSSPSLSTQSAGCPYCHSNN